MSSTRQGLNKVDSDPDLTALVQEELGILSAQKRIQEQLGELETERKYLMVTKKVLEEEEAEKEQPSIAPRATDREVTGRMKELSLEESVPPQGELTLKELASTGEPQEKQNEEKETVREQIQAKLLRGRGPEVRSLEDVRRREERARQDYEKSQLPPTFGVRIHAGHPLLKRCPETECRLIFTPDNEFCCTLTGKPFRDPVVHPDGITYEREAIQVKDPQAICYHNRTLEFFIDSRRPSCTMSPDSIKRILFCPITGGQMRNPMIDPEGITFEQWAIVQFVRQHGRSPLTNTPLKLEQLYNNTAVKVLIQDLAQQGAAALVHAEHPLLRSCPNTEYQLLRGPGNEICCPLTSKPYRDPVVHPDGITYEREAIPEKDPQAVCFPNRTLEAFIDSRRPNCTMRSDKNDILFCPITRDRMRNPVIDPEGNTFEEFAIAKFIRQHGKSPLTNTPLRLEQLYDNTTIKALILDLDKQGGAVKCVLVRDLASEQGPPPYCSCEREGDRDAFLNVAAKCMGADPPQAPQKGTNLGGHRTAYHHTHRLLYRMDKKGICYCVITTRTIAWTVAVELLREVIQCLDSVGRLQDEDMNGLQRVQTPEGNAIIVSLCRRFNKPETWEVDVSGNPVVPSHPASSRQPPVKAGSQATASKFPKVVHPRLQDETVLTELALYNFEIFHGMPRGSATCLQVADTSAGLQGWAACGIDDVVVDKPQEDKEDHSKEESVPETKPPAAKKAKTKGDKEEEEMLKRAMMESVLEAKGVRPPSRPVVPDTDPFYYDSDSSSSSCMDDDNASYVYDDDDSSQACSECPGDEGYSNDEDNCSQAASSDEAPSEAKDEEEEDQSLDPSKSDDSWSQVSKESSHLSDPVVVDSCDDSCSQQSASSGFSAYDFLE